MERKKDEISLVELYLKLTNVLSYLWRKKILILLIGISGSIIGLTFAFFTPIRYNAKLSFIVEQQSSSSLGSFSGIASNFGFSSLAGEKGLYDNQVNLISYFKSRTVVEEALLSKMIDAEQSYADKFAQLEGWKEDWKSEADGSDIDLNKITNFTRQEDSVMFEIYKLIIHEELLRISVPDDDGSIIQIAFLSESQELSKEFIEKLLEVVSKNYLAAKTRLTRENVEILQHQTDSVRQVLNEALAENANATDKVFGLNPAYAVERVPASKNQIDIQVSSLVLQELVKNLEMAKVRLMDQTPLIEVIDYPKYPLEVVKNGKISTAIKFGLISVFLFISILLLIRMIKNLHKAATQQ